MRIISPSVPTFHRSSCLNQRSNRLLKAIRTATAGPCGSCPSASRVRSALDPCEQSAHRECDALETSENGLPKIRGVELVKELYSTKRSRRARPHIEC